jgi:hypothetical protein
MRCKEESILVKIVKEATKNKIQVDLINQQPRRRQRPLIAQKIAERLHKETQQRLF